jgi:hypothetical protein
MKSIGIDQSTHDIYESSTGVWYSVWPANPVVSVAAFIASDRDSCALEHDLSSAQSVFREDSFDPVTRIRRGRFYKSCGNSRPSNERALLHPVYGTRGSLSPEYGSEVERRLFTFNQLECDSFQQTVAIGSGDSLWRILGVERIITGEYLVTLKARHALGVLPQLNSEAIPKMGRKKAIETFDKLVDSAYRETPGSIIDRARDATQWLLSTWFANNRGDNSLLHEDLGHIIKKIDHEHDKPEVILSAAKVVARLHARGKPNEQERYNTRPLMEADAEFALAAVGLLLREFGWTS